MSNQRLLVIPAVLGLLAAGFVAVGRLQDEAADRTVGLVADFAEVQTVAALTGRELTAVLAELKRAGVTGVAVEEPTFADLVRNGLGTVEASSQGTGFRPALVGRQGMAAAEILQRRFGARGMAGILTVQAPWSAVADAGAGLDSGAVETIQAAGLDPVARLRNAPGLRPGDARVNLQTAAGLGCRLVIFSGDQVIGHPEQLEATAAAVAEIGLTWGRVEFSQQKGEAGLAEHLLRGRHGYVRVHSITTAEMAKLQPVLAVERYRRAVEERNIRVAFVRLLLIGGDDLLGRNAAFVGDIAAALRDSGFELAAPTRAAPTSVPLGLRVVIAVPAVAFPAGWLLVWLPGTWETRRWLRYSVGLAVLTALVAALSARLYAQGMALLAGIVWPTIGGRWAVLRLTHDPRPVSTKTAVGVLWGSVGCAAVGGLATVGLLSETRYMLHHDQFLGVKLSQLGPLVLIALIAASGLTLPGVDRRVAVDRLRDLWQSPIRVWQVVAALVALLALVVLLLRSGNEGTEVSTAELRLRALLENTLGARPRFKEMLLGHPALILAGVAAARGRKAWVPVLVLVGAVGLASTFNTFCHLHTPLLQSIVRTIHALWIGTLLGLVLGAVVLRRPRDRRAE